MNKFLLIIISVLFLINTVFADTNGIWIDAKDVKGGTFGSDESNQNFNFLGVVDFTDNINYKGTLLENFFVIENQANSITTNMIQDNSISKNKLQENSVGIREISQVELDTRYILEGQANSISTNMIRGGAITNEKILPGEIGINKVKQSEFDNRYALSSDVYTKSQVYRKDQVYTKSQVYSKSEVNSMIASAVSMSSPSSCPARSMGSIPCTFNVPSAEHGQIVRASSDGNRWSGNLEAQCMDGSFQVLSQTCRNG